MPEEMTLEGLSDGVEHALPHGIIATELLNYLHSFRSSIHLEQVFREDYRCYNGLLMNKPCRGILFKKMRHFSDT